MTLSAFDPVRRENRSDRAIAPRPRRPYPPNPRGRSRREGGKGSECRDQRGGGGRPLWEANCPGLPREVLDIFGRLRYRTSYGQNQLRHAVETAHIAAMIRALRWAPMSKLPDTAPFLHDLGKAVDHDVEGTHAIIGADIARRFNTARFPLRTALKPTTKRSNPAPVEAIIVQLSDAISGGRPGARRDSFEHYVKTPGGARIDREFVRRRGAMLRHSGPAARCVSP